MLYGQRLPRGKRLRFPAEVGYDCDIAYVHNKNARGRMRNYSTKRGIAEFLALATRGLRFFDIRFLRAPLRGRGFLAFGNIAARFRRKYVALEMADRAAQLFERRLRSRRVDNEHAVFDVRILFTHQPCYGVPASA